MSKPTMSQWDLRLQRCSCHSRKSRLVLTSQPFRGRISPQLHLHKRRQLLIQLGDPPSQSLGRELQPRLRVQHHHCDTDPRSSMWKKLHSFHSDHRGHRHRQDHPSPWRRRHRHRHRRQHPVQLPTQGRRLRLEGLKDSHSLEDLKGLPSCKPKQLLQLPPMPRKRLSG